MENFLEYQNDEYGSGIEMDEYNGQISLVNARRGKDGNIYKDWCYPQRDKKPIEKSLPWKIRIGSSPEEAIETLRHFIGLLDGTKSYETHSTKSAQEYSVPPVEDVDDIPW